ncbi:glycosyltransferase family 4 protein [Brevundimonas sp. 2R-24]|uniref:Glycosyltransferase family 4 protein n=1 Tax=Peiella sedimenti TaxID=3061083 RepID=A0ABT8SJW8_9CAUL|nr:glycosyltransferase family 4 protein [Caulobacteraceae bacterium XZ-24]
MPNLPSDFTLLQVVPRLDAGGVERTTLDIGRAVVQAGGRSLVASEGGRLEEALEQQGSRLVRLKAASKNPFTILSNGFRLARLAREEAVTVIHARSRAPMLSALIAGRLARVPVIATYHGVYNARSPLKRWYNGLMTRGVQVIANSAYTARHLIAEHRVNPAKVTVADRGSDLSLFDPGAVAQTRVDQVLASWGIEPGDNRARILCAARLTRWKGQTVMIEAAARLKALGRDDFLVILAGDDQGRSAYRQELEALIQARGVADRVRLAGHLTDMPAAWMACDIGAAPSIEPEAFGRTAVEPQLMARPVIASAHGAPMDTILDGETGLLAAPGDADAWAAAMARLIDLGPEGRAAMGARAADRARRLYSLDAMVEATFRVYGRVVSSSGGA